MARKVEGTVYILDCPDCGQASPLMIFSGDTDMVTFGLASLTSSTANEIVIMETEQAEWRDETGRILENRINKLLSRSDLRFVRLLRAEEVEYPSGLSFEEFRRVHRAPRLAYSCPNCVVGEAVSGRFLTMPEYRHQGGKLTVLGDLELCD